MALPEAGSTAKVSNPRGIGEGFGAVPFGTEVTVTDVLEPGTPGVGDHGQYAVVRVEFDEPSLVLNDQGFPENGSVRRALSVSEAQFAEWFSEGGQ